MVSSMNQHSSSTLWKYHEAVKKKLMSVSVDTRNKGVYKFVYYSLIFN